MGWYRELAGKPLYSFDLRGKPPNAGKHWSAEPTFGFGQRANFRVSAAESNTALVIKDVSLMDEGVYRCRVDYRNSPTRNMKLNLTVVGKNVENSCLSDAPKMQFVSLAP